jgi:hypothetical protein
MLPWRPLEVAVALLGVGTLPEMCAQLDAQAQLQAVAQSAASVPRVPVTPDGMCYCRALVAHVRGLGLDAARALDVFDVGETCGLAAARVDSAVQSSRGWLHGGEQARVAERLRVDVWVVSDVGVVGGSPVHRLGYGFPDRVALLCRQTGLHDDPAATSDSGAAVTAGLVTTAQAEALLQRWGLLVPTVHAADGADAVGAIDLDVAGDHLYIYTERY